MKTLALMLLLTLVVTATVNSYDVTIFWDANDEADLAGYRLYWGKESRNYMIVLDVGMNTTYTLHDFQDSTMYYFAVTAYDTATNESSYSNEDSVYVAYGDETPPAPPTGCKAVGRK
ncbi:MAG: fibronectin type III domain-containing protein [Candidatus Peribacteraceae bacterium]|nr:fibronectin type III domain-containing protein [Candidatus Peribacteraceae bacterium]